MDLNKKVAVVTGVSKGIGLETVKQLLDAGAIVAGWGRSAPDLKHANFTFIKTDVSDWENVQASYQFTVDKIGVPVVLVNNAGLGHQGLIHEMPVEQWKEMFDINVHGLFYCIKVTTPGMIAAGEGHIVNVSSIAGTSGVKTMSGYVGTKHAVTGISHSIFLELREHGIKVTTIYPGSTNTNFFDNIEFANANDNMMRPQDVATSIVQAVQTHANYHVVDIEVRPLWPNGKPNK
ncbi:MAG: NADP-dependent 3-hydroxy acid dehydrogenase YdfG [Roseivirga sp.]|jgi:NADP-dependent 3-hydroxy acid dehydrogenase YdfG